MASSLMAGSQFRSCELVVYLCFMLFGFVPISLWIASVLLSSAVHENRQKHLSFYTHTAEKQA